MKRSESLGWAAFFTMWFIGCILTKDYFFAAMALGFATFHAFEALDAPNMRKDQ